MYKLCLASGHAKSSTSANSSADKQRQERRFISLLRGNDGSGKSPAKSPLRKRGICPPVVVVVESRCDSVPSKMRRPLIHSRWSFVSFRCSSFAFCNYYLTFALSDVPCGMRVPRFIHVYMLHTQIHTRSATLPKAASRTMHDFMLSHVRVNRHFGARIVNHYCALEDPDGELCCGQYIRITSCVFVCTVQSRGERSLTGHKSRGYDGGENDNTTIMIYRC